MKLTHEKSSNLHSSTYDEQTKEFRMTFMGKDGGPGATYSYQNVPQEVFDGFGSVESHGRYFHENIRKNFKGVKVE